MRVLDSQTIEDITRSFEMEAFLSNYQLKTKIIQQPRYILDVVILLQFCKAGSIVTVSVLGEADDDFIMIIIAEGENLENRTTLFRTLNNLKLNNVPCAMAA